MCSPFFFSFLKGALDGVEGELGGELEAVVEPGSEELFSTSADMAWSGEPLGTSGRSEVKRTTGGGQRGQPSI